MGFSNNYCLLKLCFLLLCAQGLALNTLDTLKPLTKLSPTRGVGDPDEFGYTAIAHTVRNATGFSDTLNSTFLLIGAPLGRYPGGLNLSLNASVCRLRNLSLTQEELDGLSEEQIRQCYLRSGLVYMCPLAGSDKSCVGLFGNNDKTGPDGALFDRVGNIEVNDEIIPGQKLISQNKNNQRMGHTLFSSGGSFVACAPFWENTGRNNDNTPALGTCVFSGQSLADFQYTKPCSSTFSSNNGGDEFCTSGIGAAITRGSTSSDAMLGVGAPGRRTNTGKVFYFGKLDAILPGTNTELGLTRTADTSQPNPGNDYLESLYGFTITTGQLNSTLESFFVSSPKYRGDNLSPIGRVSVVSDESQDPLTSVDGDEFGEYFGYSLASVDLNGDGYDDLVAGAPIYTESNMPEKGRVIILYNNMSTNFIKGSVITGNVAYGRFGNAVAGLGDLNNDGFEDVAVGAPFDGNGKVFIFYGMGGNTENTIINTTAQQVITAEQMVAQVTNLTALKGFGFSLDGKVDVDGNQYRDLVVGAVTQDEGNGGQAVFVLRAFPVADVSLSMTSDVTEISRDSRNCILDNGPTSCYNFIVCANFTGKGLDSIAPYYQLRADTVQPSIFFNPSDNTSSIITGTFDLQRQSEMFCKNFTAYIRNDIPQGLNSFQFTFSLLQFERSQSPIDTNFEPDDLMSSPVIVSSSITRMVDFTLNCGDDNVCYTDLNLAGTVKFLDFGGVEQQEFIVGQVQQVEVDLVLSNSQEDAFSTTLTFDLPSVFSNPIITPAKLLVSCVQSVNDSDNYTCSGFPSPLTKTMPTRVQLKWQVSSDLQGNGSFDIPINFNLVQTENNKENSSLLANNRFNINLQFQSKAVVGVSVPSKTIMYHGNISATELSSTFTKAAITYDLRNQGPSTIYDSVLNILIPLRPQNGKYYYIYPVEININSELVSCDTNNIINPENHSSLVPNEQRRSLSIRQNNNNNNNNNGSTTIELNCISSPSNCEKLRCELSNITKSTTVSITLTVLVDERFFYEMDQNLRLVTTIEAQIKDDFLTTEGSVLYSNGTLTLSRLSDAPNNSIQWYVIVIPAVSALVLIILLAVILYFCGFFRRHKPKDDEVEAFNNNPFGDQSGVVVATAPQNPSEKQEKETEKEKPSEDSPNN